MEKPTGVIQKIIESLQQINAYDFYSPIEKDIILHNLRAAYMIFLGIPTEKESLENRIGKLFETNYEPEQKNHEDIEQEAENKNSMVETVTIEAPAENEIIETEKIIEVEKPSEVPDEDISKEQVPEEEVSDFKEQTQMGSSVIEMPKIKNDETTKKILQDDISEFIPGAKPQPALLFDEIGALKPEKKSLNDLLTEKKDEVSLGSKFQQSYIPDLTKAIAINEKFTFIRELFHNSGVEFSNAIQKLNECENIDSAFVLMEDLKHQYIWDTTSSSYLSLCDLIRRRFL